MNPKSPQDERNENIKILECCLCRVTQSERVSVGSLLESLQVVSFRTLCTNLTQARCTQRRVQDLCRTLRVRGTPRLAKELCKTQLVRDSPRLALEQRRTQLVRDTPRLATELCRTQLVRDSPRLALEQRRTQLVRGTPRVAKEQRVGHSWCEILHDWRWSSAGCCRRNVPSDRRKSNVGRCRRNVFIHVRRNCGSWYSAGAGATDMAVAVLQRLCCTQQQSKACDAATYLAPLVPTSLVPLVLAPNVIIGRHTLVTCEQGQRLNCDAYVHGRPNHETFHTYGSRTR